MELFGGLIPTVAKRVTPTPGPVTPPAAKKADTKKPSDAPVNKQAQVFFGKKVRELRDAAGLSQADLAPLVGIAQTRLPAIEQGRRDVRISTIRKFARALGVSPQDLLPPD